MELPWAVSALRSLLSAHHQALSDLKSSSPSFFSPISHSLRSSSYSFELLSEFLLFLLPIWVSILIGLVIGWSWRPRWVNNNWVSFLVVALRTRPRLAWSLPPGLGARRLWLAALAATIAPLLRDWLERIRCWMAHVCQQFEKLRNHGARQLQALQIHSSHVWSPPGLVAGADTFNSPLFSFIRGGGLSAAPNGTDTGKLSSPLFCLPSASSLSASPTSPPNSPLSSSQGYSGSFRGKEGRSEFLYGNGKASVNSTLPRTNKFSSFGNKPSFHVCKKSCVPHPGDRVLESDTVCSAVDEIDLTYLLSLLNGTDGGPTWDHLMSKEAKNMKYEAWRRDPKEGPTQYRSCTLFHDVSSSLLCDFFFDDAFRVHWDSMLSYAKTVETCENSGTQLVHWVRKFPLFCKDRDYLIGRRVWSEGDTYYCVTKGSLNHPSVPRRDKPRRVDVMFSSWRIRQISPSCCEVLLFHFEEMGVHRDLAKMGVRQGMWTAVKKMEPGVERYKREKFPAGGAFGHGGPQPLPHLPRCASVSRVPPPLLSPSISSSLPPSLALRAIRSSAEVGGGEEADRRGERGRNGGNSRGDGGQRGRAGDPYGSSDERFLQIVPMDYSEMEKRGEEERRAENEREQERRDEVEEGGEVRRGGERAGEKEKRVGLLFKSWMSFSDFGIFSSSWAKMGGRDMEEEEGEEEGEDEESDDKRGDRVDGGTLGEETENDKKQILHFSGQDSLGLSVVAPPLQQRVVLGRMLRYFVSFLAIRFVLGRVRQPGLRANFSEICSQSGWVRKRRARAPSSKSSKNEEREQQVTCRRAKGDGIFRTLGGGKAMCLVGGIGIGLGLGAGFSGTSLLLGLLMFLGGRGGRRGKAGRGGGGPVKALGSCTGAGKEGVEVDRRKELLAVKDIATL